MRLFLLPAVVALCPRICTLLSRKRWIDRCCTRRCLGCWTRRGRFHLQRGSGLCRLHLHRLSRSWLSWRCSSWRHWLHPLLSLCTCPCISLLLGFSRCQHLSKLLLSLLSFSHDLFGYHVRPVMQTILLKLQVLQVGMVNNDVVNRGLLSQV